MDHQSPKPVVRACVLAAGTSSRFGETKLVQQFHGTSIVQTVLRAAQAACGTGVWLVVGHDQDVVVKASHSRSPNVVVNDAYKEGIGTSISSGVRACRRDADAILILLADQPLITAAHLEDLIDMWSGAENEIIASSFEGITSPPILFPSSAFDVLSNLKGDSGAKSLLANKAFVVKSIDFPPAGFDIDTPEDLRRLNQD